MKPQEAMIGTKLKRLGLPMSEDELEHEHEHEHEHEMFLQNMWK